MKRTLFLALLVLTLLALPACQDGDRDTTAVPAGEVVLVDTAEVTSELPPGFGAVSLEQE